MSFTITGLDPKQFEHLRHASDEELVAFLAERTIVDGPGSPDRVTLRDLPVGSRVVLLNYEHQPSQTPYRASHAIYVAPDEREAEIYRDELPQALRDRLLSLRAFDGSGAMLDATVVDGKVAGPAIEGLFANAKVAYIHAHFAARGCYAAKIVRA